MELEMKVVQKSIRLTQRVYDYIDHYRGDNFCDKLQNLVLDLEGRMNEFDTGRNDFPVLY